MHGVVALQPSVTGSCVYMRVSGLPACHHLDMRLGKTQMAVPHALKGLTAHLLFCPICIVLSMLLPIKLIEKLENNVWWSDMLLEAQVGGPPEVGGPPDRVRCGLVLLIGLRLVIFATKLRIGRWDL